jgi:HK97 family phage major capsid protein
MTTLAEAKSKVRELSKKALDTVEDASLTNAEKKNVLDKVEPEIKTWTDEVQTLERFEDSKKAALALLSPDGADPADDQAGGEKAWRNKSLGEQFVTHANYAKLVEGGVSGKTGRWSSGAIELKTALTEGTAGVPGPGYAPVQTPTVLPGITDLRFQPLTVADLFPSGSTTSPLLRYLVETAVTNAAATVAELALKPESAITFAKVDEVLKKIATFLPVSDEMLEDFDQIRSYLDARLTLFVKLQEEVQLLRGDGTGTNLVGILNRAGLAATIARGAGVSPVGDNDMDAIYRQITAIRTTSFLEPETIVIDPLGWQNIVLSKDLNGQYYAGGPFMSTANPTLWGKPVVPTTAMPASTALVGAFRQASQVFRKGGLTVEASNSHADFFQRNETAIRAEERLLLAVYRPGAFGTVTNL